MSITDIETGHVFARKPRAHQLEAWRVSRDKEAYALLMDMGCVSGSAMVTLNRGGNAKTKPLGEWYAWFNGVRRPDFQGFRNTWSRSYIDGELRLNRVLGILDKGVRPVITFSLVSGTSISVTPDHEMLVGEDWIEAQNLSVGQCLMTTSGAKKLATSHIVKDLACYLCGSKHNVASSVKSRFFGECRSCIMKRQYHNSDGRCLDKDGYVRINGFVGHPRASECGQIYEHLIVAERELGRALLPEEEVHHKNRIRRDNRPENLEVCATRLEHLGKHRGYQHLAKHVFVPNPDQIVRIESGEDHVYDIQMESPGNSFVANGVVVHNCGKTKVLLDTASYLYERDQIGGLIVVAPKGVYLNWLDNEIPEDLPNHIPRKIGLWDASGSADDKRSLIPFESYTGRRKELMVLLMNIEAFSSKRAPTLAWQFMKKCPCLMVIDESTTIKRHSSKRTENILKLARYAKYRRIMSGEPAANSPLDLWSQFEFLGPGLLGSRTFYGFRATYANLVKQKVGYGESKRSFVHVAGFRNIENLREKMKPHCFIVKKEDCLDLPPKVYQQRITQMGKQQREAYDMMAQQSVVIIDEILKGHRAPTPPPLDVDRDYQFDPNAQMVEAEPAKPGSSVMTAQIVITQILRLHQIVCGFMTVDGLGTAEEGSAKATPAHMRAIAFDENPRLEDLIQALEEVSGKALIWANYRHNIREIEARLKKEYGVGSVGTYYGGTPQDERRRVIREFQNNDSEMRWFLGSQSAAGRGLTLTAADKEFFYSNNYNAEVRNQAEDRAYRIGQTRMVTIVDLVCPGTVEVDIIAALRSKKKLSELITPSNWRDFILRPQKVAEQMDLKAA
jgi:Mesyanzhinovviridae DNA helicase